MSWTHFIQGSPPDLNFQYSNEISLQEWSQISSQWTGSVRTCTGWMDWWVRFWLWSSVMPQWDLRITLWCWVKVWSSQAPWFCYQTEGKVLSLVAFVLNLNLKSLSCHVPLIRLMLWSEIGSTPQIERSGMDGSKRKVVVSSGLSWPVSLAFDLLDNRVYWADEKLRCIGSASLDGDYVKVNTEKERKS